MAFNPLFSPKVIQLSLLGFLFDDTVFYAMTSLQKFAPPRRLSPRSEPHGADMLRAPHGTPDLPASVKAWRRQTGLADLAQASACTLSREDADPPSNARPVSPKAGELPPPRADAASAARRITPKCLGGCGRAPDRALTLWEKRLLIKHIRWQQTQLIT
jgi:hypothetical protein